MDKTGYPFISSESRTGQWCIRSIPFGTERSGWYLIGLFILSLFFPLTLVAEGTNPLSPTADDYAFLVVRRHSAGQAVNNFAHWNNADPGQRLYIKLLDPTRECIYMQFNRTEGVGSSSGTGDFRFRIKDPNGNVVYGPIEVTEDNDNDRFTEIFNGPGDLDIGGYRNPFQVEPTDLTAGGWRGAGDYYIEFQNLDPNGPDDGEVRIRWWDITVVDCGARPALSEKKGRLWSKNWNISATAFPNTFKGAVYVCIPDKVYNGNEVDDRAFVIKADFEETELKPNKFEFVFNRSGISNTQDVLTDRQSSTERMMLPEYPVFLFDPVDVYKTGDYGEVSPFVTLERCGAEEYCFMAQASEPGEIEIILDLDGDGRYSPDGLDVILGQRIDIGDVNQPVCVSWDGKNGLNADIDAASLSSSDVIARFKQGVTHFVIFDAEAKESTLDVTAIRPAQAIPIRFFWDDTRVGVYGLFSESTDPCYITPGCNSQPENLNGCDATTDDCHIWYNHDSDDESFGSSKTINTWWYLNEKPLTFVPSNPGYYDCSITGPDSICAFEQTWFTCEVEYLPAGADLPPPVPSFSWTGPNGFVGNSATIGPLGAIDVGIYECTLSWNNDWCTMTVQVELVERPIEECCVPEISCDPQFDTTVEMEGCASDIPATISDPELIFDLETCGAEVELIAVDSGDTDLCSDGDGVDIIRTYTVALNGIEQSETCAQRIQILDSQAPQNVTCPDDITINGCGPNNIPNPEPSLVSATDNCGVTISAFVSDDITGSDICTGNGLEVFRTYRVTDACGNSTSCQQSILLIDDIAPQVLSCPVDVTLSCEDSTAPAEIGEITGTDNCTPDPKVIFNDIESLGDCGGTGIITRAWRIEDDCGNASSCIQIITIQDDQSPLILNCPDDVTIECFHSRDPLNTGELIATDNCGIDPLVIFEDDENLTGCSGTGEINRTWRAEDECGNSITCLQQIRVIDSQSPLISDCPVDISISCADPIDPEITGNVEGLDDCNAPLTSHYVDMVSFDGCNSTGVITRTWKVEDDCGNEISCIQSIYVLDTEAPLIIDCPVDLTLSCGQLINPSETGVPDAVDNCQDLVEVIYSDIEDLADCNSTGTIFRVWTARDDCGNSSTCTQEITVQDLSVPVITNCPVDITVECYETIDTSVTGAVVASDNCFGDLAIEYEDIGMLSNCSNTGSLQRTWTVRDGCGNSSTCVQNLLVVDTEPPEISRCPGDVTVECDASTEPEGIGEVESLDQCGTELHTAYEDIVAFDGCNNTGNISRTWTVTDECGNSATCIQNILIVDTTPPVISCPEDVTVACVVDADPLLIGEAEVSDNCDSNPDVNYTDDASIADCTEGGIIWRTWSAIDACGNESVCEQYIDVLGFEVGLAMDLGVGPINNEDGTYTFSLDILVENSGNASLTGLELSCDLATLFGAGNFSIDLLESNDLAVNNSFDGSTDLQLLAPDNELNVGEEQRVRLTITVTPNLGLGIYLLNAEIVGENADGQVVSDLSQNGINTDPDGDGDPTNNNEPTPIEFRENAGIGLAKWVSAGPEHNGDGTFSLTYSIRVVNTGDVQLQDIQIEEDLDEAFGGNDFQIEYLISNEFNTNPDFTGSNNPLLLTGQNILASGDSGEIMLKMRVLPGSYGNQVTGYGNTPGGDTVSDDSQSGMDIDPDGDGDPTNNDDKTTIEIDEDPGLGVAMDIIDGPLNNGDGSFTFTLIVLIENTGYVPLNELQLFGNLASVFGDGNFQINGINSSSASINTGYDGKNDQKVLNGNDVLGFGEKIHVEINLTVFPDQLPGLYLFNTEASGESPDGLVVMDLSQQGKNVDPDGDGDPKNNNDATPINFTEEPGIGLAKWVSAGPDDNGDGTYSLTFTILVVNTGDVELKDIQVVEDLFTVFGGNNYEIESFTSPALTLNQGFDGFIDRDLLTGEDVLAPKAREDIMLNLTVLPGTYGNQVTGTGTTPGGDSIVDDSQSGMDVDPDGDGDPTNNNEITVVDLECELTLLCSDPIINTFSCIDDVPLPDPESIDVVRSCSGDPLVLTEIYESGSGCVDDPFLIQYTHTFDDDRDTLTLDDQEICIVEYTVIDDQPPLIDCPADVTVECFDQLDPLYTGQAVAVDQCDDIAGLVTYSDVVIGSGCGTSGNVMRTWQSFDACGNSGDCVQIINVFDSIAPEIVCPDDHTIYVDEFCDYSIGLYGMPSSVDDCDNGLTFAYTDDLNGLGGAAQTGDILRSWVAIDPCENESSCIQTITVADTISPILFGSLSDTLIEVHSECDTSVQWVAPTFMDNCPGGNLISNFLPGDLFSPGITTVYYVAEDASGNLSDTLTFEVEVIDVSKPLVICPEDITVIASTGATPLTVDDIDLIQQSDNCDIGSVEAVVNGIFSAGSDASNFGFDFGINDVVYTATDIHGNIDSCSFTVTIIEDNDPSLGLIIPDIALDCSIQEVEIPVIAENEATIDSLFFTVRWDNNILSYTGSVSPFFGSDPDLNIAGFQNELDVSWRGGDGQKITEGDTLLVLYLNVNTPFAGGLDIEVVPGASGFAPGPIDVTIVPGAGNLQFVDEEAPQIQNCPEDRTVSVFTTCETRVNWDEPTVIDNCTAGTMVSNADPGDLFAVGYHEIIYVAEDEEGNVSDTCRFGIEVIDSGPPVIECPPDTVILVANGILPGTISGFDPVSVSDNCGLTDVILTINGVDDSQGPVAPDTTNSLTYTVVDAAGNTANCTFQVDYEPFAVPEIELETETKVVSCSSDSFQVALTLTDSFTLASLQFTIGWDDEVMNLDTAYAVGFEDNFLFGPANMDDAVTFSWFGPPLVSFQPGDTILLLQFNAFASIGDTASLFFPQQPTNPQASVPPGPFLTNVKLISGDILFEDEGPPMIDCPSDVTVFTQPGECKRDVIWDDPVVVDDCDPSPMLEADVNSGEMLPVGTTVITYKATDASGYWSSCELSVTVIDDQLPQISPLVDSVFYADANSCELDLLAIGMPVVYDNCGIDTFYADYTGVLDPGVNTVPYVAIDIYGNTDTLYQSITILDTIPPLIDCRDTMRIQAAGSGCYVLLAEVPFPDLKENCSLDSQWVTGPDTLFIGSYPVEFGLIDASGNEVICESVLIVEDAIAPVLDCPDDKTVSTDDMYCFATGIDLDSIAVQDNCGSVMLNYPQQDTLPVGVHVLTYNAVDANGNEGSCDVMVTVRDDKDPGILCPDDVTVVANMPGGAIIDDIDAIYTDNCGVESLQYRLTGATDGASPMSGINQPSGSFFEMGTTMLNFLVTDESGNSTFCFSRIEVVPAIEVSCPDDVSIEAEFGYCYTEVDDIFLEIDSNGMQIDSIIYFIDGIVPGSGVGDASGSVFYGGENIVTYIVYPAIGLPDTCSFIVEVVDVESPYFTTCPDDITLEATVDCEVAASWNIPFPADNCPTTTISSTHDPGDLFGYGTTTVSYFAVDGYGNSDTCSFTVTVIDNIPPTIDCVDDLVVQADDGQISEVVAGIEPQGVSDNCGVDSILFTLSGATTGQGVGDASGSTFNIGVTEITYTVVDLAGNTIQCSFTITVNSPGVPDFVCPEDVTVSAAPGACSAQVTGIELDVVTNNIAGISYTMTGATTGQGTGDISGSVFNVGVTVVSYTIIDNDGDQASCSFEVTVIDFELPQVIVCPSDITIFVEPGDCKAAANWPDAVFSDNCGSVDIAGTHTSGDLFPAGDTQVILTGTDAAGNAAECSFTVTVIDNIPPIFVDCPADMTVEVPMGECYGILDWSVPMVEDNCDGVTLYSTYAPGDSLLPGTYDIEYLAIDSADQRTTCSFEVTVLDQDPPEIVCPGDIAVTVDGFILSDPDNIIRSISTVDCESVLLQLDAPEAWDPCGGDVVFSQVGVMVVSDRVNLPIGMSIMEYTATDISGNTVTCSFAVEVAPQEPLEVTSTTNPVCEGDTLQLFGGTIPGGSYVWTGPNGYVSNTQNPEIPIDSDALEGMYSVQVSTDQGCRYDASIFVDVVPVLEPEEVITANGPLCEGEDLILLTPLIPGALYSWTGPNGYESDIYNPVIYDAEAADMGTYTVTITYDGCGSPLQASFEADIIPAPLPPVAIADEMIGTAIDFPGIDVLANDTIRSSDMSLTLLSQPTFGTLIEETMGYFVYLPESAYVGSDTFQYEICHSNECDVILCDTASVILEVEPGEECILFNTITPNGDGINDEVYVPCLDVPDPPDNELIIHSEWGVEVYRASPYENDWKGTYNGEPLPDGTYYYLLRIPEYNLEERGYITLFR